MDYYSIMSSYSLTKNPYSAANMLKKNNKTGTNNSESNFGSKAAEAYAELQENGMSDTDKINAKVSMIAEKIKNGIELNESELDFLEKHSPSTYQMAKEAIKVRETFLKKMKLCRSKEEVNALKLSSDLDCMKRLKAAEAEGNDSEALKEVTFKNTTQNEYNRFVGTEEYKELPKEKSEKEL